MRSVQEPVIDVCRISKRYFLGGVLAERKLVDVLGSAASRFASVLRSPRGSHKNRRSAFWALRDLSFQVTAGEVVGIVGNNGAGKSTLLKILSRITEPTHGSVSYTGRVGSLLEVGTGFHPELSGRDNIFLNGAILGMRRREILRRFDEIVAFAGVDRFIDTPVKRYSSGMYTRLAFAVSAHLDTDIMLVDEVLAVGDLNFQNKCLARMSEVARDGRTVLFVSHNLTSIKALCARTLVLNGGRLEEDGPTSQVLAQYLRNNIVSDGLRTARRWSEGDAPPGGTIRIIEVSVAPIGETPNDPIFVTTGFAVRGRFRNLTPDARLSMSVMLHNQQGLLLFDAGSWDGSGPLATGTYESSCVVPGCFLNDGDYSISLAFRDRDELLLELPHVLEFQILDSEDGRDGWFGKWDGVLRPRFLWRMEAVDNDQAPQLITVPNVPG
jgi:lipopolysaccharide transport system ATP-binding protein